MYNQSNIFAKIIRGEIPSKKIHEDDSLLAIWDAAPATLIHALVIPKGEYIDYTDFVTNATQETISHFFKEVARIAHKLCPDGNFRLCTNNGEQSGQTIFHFHVHILGGMVLGSFA